jgi:hypothetical protein
MERTGIEPVASGLQSGIRPLGLSRVGRGLPVRAGISSVVLRGLPGAAGGFRRPRAGCLRDGVAVYAVNTRSPPAWPTARPAPN